MTPVIRPTNDKTFAETLIRHNMAAYHQQLGWHWDSALFDQQWRELESFKLVINATPVGVLCLHQEDDAYHIRELQIAPPWQRQGLGTAALHFAEAHARQAGIHRLRLRVFRINPAMALYERMGFRVLNTEEAVHAMERRIV